MLQIGAQPWGPAGSCRTGIGVQGASHLSPRALRGGLFSMPSLSPVITPRTLLTTLNARLQVLTGNRIDQKVASGYQRTRVSVPHAHGDSGSLCGSSFWVRLTVPNTYRFLLIKLLLVQKSISLSGHHFSVSRLTRGPCDNTRMSLRTEFGSEVSIEVCKAARQHAPRDRIIKAAKVQHTGKYLRAQALESGPCYTYASSFQHSCDLGPQFPHS